ncbi:TDP-fucosamine acetyltransferase [bacterium BMS3Abin15]|nr:TDP-fucosamine acetyltransferase [bacterium BMS3Abin15]
MESVEYLDWDSKFFGFKIGRICIDTEQLRSGSLDKAVEEARANKINCLYAELPFGSPELLSYCSENKFLLVDLKTRLGKKLDNKVTRLSSSNITYKLENKYYPFLIKIAKQISIQSRFTHDLKFGREKSCKLYEEWLRKAFYEQYCDDLILYVKDDKPAGFITLRIKEGHPFIDLLGVSNEQRGKKIGTCLIKAAERKLSIAGYNTLKVVTQGHNISALSTYQSMNFRIEDMNIYYHKWID